MSNNPDAGGITYRRAPGMFITDFDGTLLTDDKHIQKKDLDTLARLKTLGIVTAIATGRSLFSFQRALEQMGLDQKDLPVDYLIFSTGAGIYCLNKKMVIRSHAVNRDGIRKIVDYFDAVRFDYMVHQAIPDTHYFIYKCHGVESKNPDFHHRISLYPAFGKPMEVSDTFFDRATEVLAIVPGSLGRNRVGRIQADLAPFSVVHATSPLDHTSSWIEVFHPDVSKSRAADWLAGDLGVAREKVVAVGNDYNDEDLLRWAGRGFLVDNGAKVLRGQFNLVTSNNDCGVSRAAQAAGII